MRKIGTIFCILALASSLTACGKYGKLQDELDTITAESTFPPVTEGATTLDDINNAVYEQQLALCTAYAEAYNKTGIDDFMLKYPKLDRDKVLSRLNDTRQDINDDSTDIFIENMALIVKDVTDIPNLSAYIEKRWSEVQVFYTDYNRFVNYGDDYSVLSDLLLKYANSDNQLASEILKHNSDQFMNAAVLRIEKNAEAKEDFRVKITENNNIINAVNNLYGGVYTDLVKRINTANRNLAVKLLNSLETLSKSEKEKLLDQLDKGEDMTIELEETPRAGTSGTARR